MFLTRYIWLSLAAVLLPLAAGLLLLLARGPVSTSRPREAAQNGATAAGGGTTEKREEGEGGATKKEKGAKAGAGKPDAATEPAPPVTVREVKVTGTPFSLGSWNDAKAFDTARAVAGAADKEDSDQAKAALKEAARGVRFGREALVVVGFGTGGPPFGKLRYTVDQKKREVEFYCEEPKIPAGEGRDSALKLCYGFFAVPAGTKVKWGGLK